MDYKDEIKLAMADVRERSSPRPGRVQGEGGGGGFDPKYSPSKQHEDIVNKWAQGKASLADVRNVFEQKGWKVDLRRGRYEVEAVDPSGTYHYIAP